MRTRAIVAAFALFSSAFLATALPQAKESDTRPTPRAARARPDFDERLPILGTRLSDAPAGAGRDLVVSACLTCHSADILRQQRLDEKKWTASVTKMVGWGAEVPDSRKDELITYLVKNFGSDNDSFRPVVTRPVGR